MARLLKKPLIIALAAVILLVIGFFAYIQNAFTGTRCEAAKHLDADMIGDCYGCHLKVTPQVAQDWYESKHGVTLPPVVACTHKSLVPSHVLADSIRTMLVLGMWHCTHSMALPLASCAWGESANSC